MTGTTSTGVKEKVEEEWREFKLELDTVEKNHARDSSGHHKNLALEFGDILFTLVNVARFVGIHPETALAGSTRKFEQRFRHMEKSAAEKGRAFETLSQAEMQGLWQRAKQALEPPESAETLSDLEISD